jgi:hypothetical protein
LVYVAYKGKTRILEKFEWKRSLVGIGVEGKIILNGY